MRLGVRKWKNFSVIFSVEAKLTNFCVSTWHSKIIYGLDVKLSVTSFSREVSFARGKFEPIWIMAFVGLMSNLAKWKAIARRAVWGHCGAKLNFLKYCVKIYKTVTKFTWFEAILRKKINLKSPIKNKTSHFKSKMPNKSYKFIQILCFVALFRQIFYRRSTHVGVAKPVCSQLAFAIKILVKFLSTQLDHNRSHRSVRLWSENNLLQLLAVK